MFLKTLGAAAAGAALGPLRSFAQGAYPSKPVTIVFPYAAGGQVDGVVRAVAEQLTLHLGQPFVVENRAGAGSSIGAQYVARAQPDGHTLLWAGWPTLTTNFALYKSLHYKLDDFAPISPTVNGVIGLAVRSDIPAQNFKEFVDYVKSKGGSLAYGTAGIGSSPHLLMELGAKAAGVNLTMISYKGEAQAVTDVMGGHLPAFAGSVTNLIQQHRAGNLRLIGISSAQRLPEYKDVPTFDEAGYPQLDFTFWHGLVAPAKTPRSIIDKLNAAVVAAMKEPTVLARLSPDQNAMTSSPEDFRRLILADKNKWGEVIVANNLSAE
jgi:tripartite-type tricarboxylate transporter receptor subunit TctC